MKQWVFFTQQFNCRFTSSRTLRRFLLKNTTSHAHTNNLVLIMMAVYCKQRLWCCWLCFCARPSKVSTQLPPASCMNQHHLLMMMMIFFLWNRFRCGKLCPKVELTYSLSDCTISYDNHHALLYLQNTVWPLHYRHLVAETFGEFEFTEILYTSDVQKQVPSRGIIVCRPF